MLLTLACSGKGEDTGQVVEVEPDQVVIRLVNPTSADPFAGVSALRLEVTVDDAVVASDEFGLDEAAELGELEDYGTVRFRLAGLSGTTVLSYGRSAEVALYPGADRSVPIVFLPINQVIPVTSDSMNSERSGHLALPMLDGRVLLVGGRTPDSVAGYADMELFDPSLMEFQAMGASLTQGTVYPMGAWTEDYSELIITGGGDIQDGGAGTLPVDDTLSLQASSLNLAIEDSMNAARVGGCFTIFRDTYGLAVGGNDAVASADYLKVDPGSGIWIWEQIDFASMDESDVTGCALADSGEVYLQGLTAGSTGVFDFTATAQVRNPDIEEAFSPLGTSAAADFLPLDGAMLIPVEGGAVWIGGGVIRDSGGGVEPINEEGQLFLVNSQTYVTAADPAVPRVNGSWDHWIEPNWAVLACGSPDENPLNVQTRVELLNLESGDRFPEIQLDRLRAECRVNTLPDGSVLITGGYTTTQTGLDSAGILVPYR